MHHMLVGPAVNERGPFGLKADSQRGSELVFSHANEQARAVDLGQAPLNDKVEVSPVQVQTAEPKAFANGKSTMLSSTLEHWFGNHKSTSEVKTTIVVAANL